MFLPLLSRLCFPFELILTVLFERFYCKLWEEDFPPSPGCLRFTGNYPQFPYAAHGALDLDTSFFQAHICPFEAQDFASAQARCYCQSQESLQAIPFGNGKQLFCLIHVQYGSSVWFSLWRGYNAANVAPNKSPADCCLECVMQNLTNISHGSRL